MTKPRNHVVMQNQSAVYHCISRCVRRAFLCGNNPISDDNYDHRRKWVEDRIVFLSALFCVKIYSYAIMNNHYHIVLATDFDQQKSLSDKDIVTRWHLLTSKQFDDKGNPLGASESTIESSLANKTSIALYRSRFM